MKKLISRLRRGGWLMVLMLPNLAFASNNSNALDSVLRKAVDILTGTPAKIMGAIAIIIIGYLTLWSGQLPKNRAIAAVLGIGFIFGAGWIMQQLGYGY